MRDDEVDPAKFMIGLSRARIRWLLIGRQALIHHGAPVQTMDYDLWVDPAPANIAKLLYLALEHDLEGPRNAKEVEARPMFSLHGGSVKIDVFKGRTFTNLDGATIDFDTVYRRRVIFRAKGDPLAPPLPSIRDLKMLKRMRDGASDREDLRFLELLQQKRKPRRKR